jgi:hypothetical protein
MPLAAAIKIFVASNTHFCATTIVTYKTTNVRARIFLNFVRCTLVRCTLVCRRGGCTILWKAALEKFGKILHFLRCSDLNPNNIPFKRTYGDPKVTFIILV